MTSAARERLLINHRRLSTDSLGLSCHLQRRGARLCEQRL
eukprot:CAMPEP_0196690022 /NCGR_PEP_ID=MMETSP1090-20130531/19565_1 /TAXON_ID=37098 /ORGANISM="Isochrysis sp, Strain CCMP1244" /LENGTH=39 /DNA_ID= /DNA_START= /DNA_END= /DNA_ORIENTATION=